MRDERETCKLAAIRSAYLAGGITGTLLWSINHHQQGTQCVNHSRHRDPCHYHPLSQTQPCSCQPASQWTVPEFPVHETHQAFSLDSWLNVEDSHQPGIAACSPSSAKSSAAWMRIPALSKYSSLDVMFAFVPIRKLRGQKLKNK
eukprot:429718-Pelagomonas_calceolata.AAC.1